MGNRSASPSFITFIKCAGGSRMKIFMTKKPSFKSGGKQTFELFAP